jgi:AraC-like DNA-binding protein/quercetin dioxygenase-like cupin family protein
MKRSKAPDRKQAPPRHRTSVPPIDPQVYAPTALRPLRAKLRHLAADTRVDPHSHPWAQVAMSSKGVIRMTAGHSTYLVPPQRALWIPPGVEHVVTVVEDADLHTLYIHQNDEQIGPLRRLDASGAWHQCRVLEVSSLLRELVPHLPFEPGDDPPTERERCIGQLVLDELAHARPVRLGVDLPHDKRLRALCETVLEDPARWTTLDEASRQAGASARTFARLFRAELDTTFVQWRQQVLLARALSMAARKLPMSTIAAELGYASASAFSAMVRRSVGMPPSRFLG